MIFGVYLLAIAGAFAWFFLRPRSRRWLIGRRAATEDAVRAAALAFSVVVTFAFSGLFVGGVLDGHDGDLLALTVLAAGCAGAVAYTVGAARWNGRRARRNRVVGWILLALALGFPSTLTLALPLLIPLAGTLVLVPARREELSVT